MRTERNGKQRFFFVLQFLVLFSLMVIVVCLPCSLALAVDTTPPTAPTGLTYADSSGVPGETYCYAVSANSAVVVVCN